MFDHIIHKNVMKEAVEKMDIWKAWSTDLIDNLTEIPDTYSQVNLQNHMTTRPGIKKAKIEARFHESQMASQPQSPGTHHRNTNDMDVVNHDDSDMYPAHHQVDEEYDEAAHVVDSRP